MFATIKGSRAGVNIYGRRNPSRIKNRGEICHALLVDVIYGFDAFFVVNRYIN